MPEHNDILKKVVMSAKRELMILCSQGKTEQALDLAEALRIMPSGISRTVVWSNARFIDQISMCAPACRFDGNKAALPRALPDTFLHQVADISPFKLYS